MEEQHEGMVMVRVLVGVSRADFMVVRMVSVREGEGRALLLSNGAVVSLATGLGSVGLMASGEGVMSKGAGQRKAG